MKLRIQFSQSDGGDEMNVGYILQKRVIVNFFRMSD